MTHVLTVSPIRRATCRALSLTASSLAAGVMTAALTLPLRPLMAQDMMTVEVSRGYALGAGDVLRLEFLNRPDIQLNIPVELNGYANFPFAGSVLVAGRTIEELRAELPVLLDGVVLREEIGDDLRSNNVSGSELILSVFSYRPIVVAGDVAVPGEVEFTVGMTARTAVFKAQGIGSVRNGASGSVNQHRSDTGKSGGSCQFRSRARTRQDQSGKEPRTDAHRLSGPAHQLVQGPCRESDRC